MEDPIGVDVKGDLDLGGPSRGRGDVGQVKPGDQLLLGLILETDDADYLIDVEVGDQQPGQNLQTALDHLPLGPTIDPVFGSIRLLNALTGGIAGRDYCLSLEEIQRFVLVKHEQVFSKMIADTSLTWRQIPDWLDAEALPDWVRYGQGSA